MTWEELNARLVGLNVIPSKSMWYRDCYSKIVVTEERTLRAGDRTREDKIWALYYHLRKIKAVYQRERLEGRTLSLFFTNPDDMSTMLDTLAPLLQVDDRHRYRIKEVHCPISTKHAETIHGGFPTKVKRGLFGDGYRYRIELEVPPGTRHDPAKTKSLENMMKDLETWESTQQGQVGVGSRKRLRSFARSSLKMTDAYLWPGSMSFYTNNQEFSLIMKLAYPDFYKLTEKAITYNEMYHMGKEGTEHGTSGNPLSDISTD